MNLPRVDAASLREAGRKPGIPFTVALADGTEVKAVRLLRVLPGKRIVAEGRCGNEAMLLKLFINLNSERYWRRELAGITALTDAAIPTPPVMHADALAGGGHAILSRFLSGAEVLADKWNAAATPQAAIDTFAPALELVAHMHQAGLVHEDLHPGNFLVHQGRTYLIDGDAVRAVTGGKALGPAQACANLALLLAQFPAEWDDRQQQLLELYQRAAGINISAAALHRQTRRSRARRLRDFLSKSRRDCTLFAVRHTFTRFTAVKRDCLPILGTLLTDPEHAIDGGDLLKDGGSATVSRVELPTGGTVVVKRYNLKNLGHALSRLWRPSRAAHSWREGLRLQFLGIATPMPLALIEERIGPLRRRAWLVTAHCHGRSLLEHLNASAEPAIEEAQALTALFRALQRERISHGDLKATNLLWQDGKIVLIDLDAARQHASRRSYRRAWRRDRARLLRNWPVDSRLHHWLDANLPPA